ncbi:30S ribosomal protein S11 [Candidatus Uhrbacteria bacterium]|nr:30S ribosomal protein S11 [Candidatus Uhrbacteria bacterium]
MIKTDAPAAEAPVSTEEGKAAVAKKGDKAQRTAKGKKRVVRAVPQGRAYIQASFNNTIVTLTDANGNTLSWASAGNCGFKGPKKATPYAASMIVKKIAEQSVPYGVKDLHVFVSGIGNGRDGALRALNANGFNVLSIKDLTPVAHNGCRPRRARRV